jgi:GST-like protein
MSEAELAPAHSRVKGAKMHIIFANPGCGSAIVEAIFELAGLPYQVEMVDPWTEGPSRERLRSVNPLLQVPALLLPDNSIMTESAAMALYAIDLMSGSSPALVAGLAPAPGDPLRPRFLRWLIFLVASIYPTFTYGDDPSRYVSGEGAQKELRARTDSQREELWRLVEGASLSPWFLGERLSVIDLYVWVMTRWRPRLAWFEANCPKLAAIAAALDADPRLTVVKERNFPAA